MTAERIAGLLPDDVPFRYNLAAGIYAARMAFTKTGAGMAVEAADLLIARLAQDEREETADALEDMGYPAAPEPARVCDSCRGPVALPHHTLCPGCVAHGVKTIPF